MLLLITKVCILESLQRLLLTVVGLMVILCMPAAGDPSDLGEKELSSLCKFQFDSRGCLQTFNFSFKSENNFTNVREFSVSYIDENGTKETIVQCDPECQNSSAYMLNWDGRQVSVSVITKCVASGMYEFDIPYEQPVLCKVTAEVETSGNMTNSDSGNSTIPTEVETSGNMTNSDSGNSTIPTNPDGTLGVGAICGISAAVLSVIVIAIVAGLVIGYKKKWKTAKTDGNGKVSVEKDKDCEAGKHVDVSKDLLEREETWDEGSSSPIQSPYVKLREKICYMPVPVAHPVDDEFSPVAHPVDDKFSPVARPVDDEFSPVAHPVDDVPSSVAHPMDDEDSYDHRVNELG